MSRSQMLRFASEEELHAAQQAKRERFHRGEIHVPERDILAACIELARKHPAVAWCARANIGCGYLIRAGDYHRLVAAGHLPASAARFQRFGFRGAADITGMLRGGRRLEVECKADRGSVSDDQTAFLEAVRGGGGFAVLVRSVNEFAAALEAE